MKRLAKRILRAAWRRTFFLRRPLMVRFESYLRRCLSQGPAAAGAETNAVLGHLLRELIRLQDQVERLHDVVDELAAARDGLSLVGETGERMRAS